MPHVTQKTVDFIKQWEQEYQPPIREEGDVFVPLLCSSCFTDEGLRLVSEQLGADMDAPCPNCGSIDGPSWID
jgi:hypothetical protein